MIYVADTHSLIWFLTNDSSLSRRAAKIFDEVEQGKSVMVIPTIVLAELFYICDGKEKLDTFFKIVEKIRNGINYMAYDLNLEIILECRNIPKIRNIHDKIIAATARLLGATVITRDKEILNSGYVETIW